MSKAAYVRERDKDHCGDVVTNHFEKVILGFGPHKAKCVFRVISETQDVVDLNSPVGPHAWKVDLHLLYNAISHYFRRVCWNRLQCIFEPEKGHSAEVNHFENAVRNFLELYF